MVRKIGNFFKKSENDWLKVTVSLVVSIVMLLFFSKILVASYAIPDTLPDTLTSGMGDNSERISLFDGLDGKELLYLVPYYGTIFTVLTNLAKIYNFAGLFIYPMVN